jgi:hypothetical protein
LNNSTVFQHWSTLVTQLDIRRMTIIGWRIDDFIPGPICQAIYGYLFSATTYHLSQPGTVALLSKAMVGGTESTLSLSTMPKWPQFCHDFARSSPNMSHSLSAS